MKILISVIALLLATTTPAAAQDSPLYRGGPIVTMDGDTPKTVAAVVTKADRIAFAGHEAGARAAARKDATIHDLPAAQMLPGFVRTLKCSVVKNGVGSGSAQRCPEHQ